MGRILFNLFLGSIFLYITILSFSSSCFITNCPPGGKRSIPEQENTNKVRECASCGPEDQGGRCYGPETCCSPNFGCMVGTPETYTCLIENRINSVCHNPGIPCSVNVDNGNINGFCATEGICCSSDSCELDEDCHFEVIPKELLPSSTYTSSSDNELKSKGQPEVILTSRLPKVVPPLGIINRFKFSVSRQRYDKRKNLNLSQENQYSILK